MHFLGISTWFVINMDFIAFDIYMEFITIQLMVSHYTINVIVIRIDFIWIFFDIFCCPNGPYIHAHAL